MAEKDPYRLVDCKACAGTGKCFPCEGTGAIEPFTDEHGIWGRPGHTYPAKRCAACRGSGRCIACLGARRVPFYTQS